MLNVRETLSDHEKIVSRAKEAGDSRSQTANRMTWIPKSKNFSTA